MNEKALPSHRKPANKYDRKYESRKLPFGHHQSNHLEKKH